MTASDGPAGCHVDDVGSGGDSGCPHLASPTAVGEGELATRHLFVVGRPVPSDPSAGYLLRLALGQQRRSGDVAVFLLDNALPAKSSRPPGNTPSPSTGEGWPTNTPSPSTGEGWGGGADSRLSPILQDLLSAGARVLIHADLCARLTGVAHGGAVQPATDADLADLLLRPGVSAIWC